MEILDSLKKNGINKNNLRAHTFTYILSLILLFCIPWGNMEVNAQRAQKRREGILTTDSIRSQNRADSLALADTDQPAAKTRIRGTGSPHRYCSLGKTKRLHSKYSASHSGEKTLDTQF